MREIFKVLPNGQWQLLKTSLSEADLSKGIVVHRKSLNQPLEELSKAAKDLIGLYKPEHQLLGKEHIKWAQTLPKSNWKEWAITNHAKDPDAFTDEHRQSIQHFAGLNHPIVRDVDLSSKDSLEGGLEKLKGAETEYKKQHAKKEHLMEPDGKKIIPTGENQGWFDTGVPYHEVEGKTMGHCGNAEGIERKTDNILSLRSEVSHLGQAYHKPHATFIENGGWLGEMKGMYNEKPAGFHSQIVELLKNPRIKGLAGGGHKPENNFHFDDLYPAEKKEVLKANPNLITDLDSYENISRALDSGLPFHHVDALTKKKYLDPRLHERLVKDRDESIRYNMAQREDLDPRFHERLVNDDNYEVRGAMTQRKNLDPRLHEQLVKDLNPGVRALIAQREDLHPKFHERLVNARNSTIRNSMAGRKDLSRKFHERLVNDRDENVRYSMAGREDLDPRFHERLVNDDDYAVRSKTAKREDLDPRFHEQLVKDLNPGVRAAMAQRKDLHPVFHEQLVNDPDEIVRYRMAGREDLDPRLHEQLVNDPDGRVRAAMAERKDLHHIFHEQLVNDSYDGYVRAAMAKRKDLDPRFHEQLINDPRFYVRSKTAQREDLDPRFHEQLVNDPDEIVRRSMAQREDLDPRFHEQLVNDSDNGVRAAMAERKGLDINLRKRLLKDPDTYVRHNARNPLE